MSKSNKIVANFFWDKNNISIYEYAFLNSFIKNDFEVNVYSFNNLNLPKKAKLKDASLILKKSEMKKFVHAGTTGCPAAFADKFRIELMKLNNGWWFDMDILCLKKSSAFKKLEKKKIVVGLETDEYVNNAVLKISDRNLLKIISKEILTKGYSLKWGDIGPKLITRILRREGRFSEALGKQYFYPINYKNFNYLLLPKYYKKAKKICEKSFTVHNYNQILNRFGIPKNILPPKGSYLYEKITNYSPELKSIETLPEYTIERLLDKKNGFKENLKDLFPSLIRSFR